MVVVFGSGPLGDAYDEVVTTLGTLAGSVLGFYFGSRGAESHRESRREVENSISNGGTSASPQVSDGLRNGGGTQRKSGSVPDGVSQAIAPTPPTAEAPRNEEEE